MRVGKFISIVSLGIEKCFPLKTRRDSNDNDMQSKVSRIKWFTQDLKIMRKKLCEFKDYGKMYRNALTISRKQKYNQFIENSSNVSRGCWRL